MRARMAIALTAALLAPAALATSAVAKDTDCGTACVILVEVDGLEPEDVTAATTPFLWQLAHPNGNPAVPGGNPALTGRNGFMWEAPRAPMTASTATSAASLLTGSNPEQHGVVADRYAVVNPTTKQLTTYRLATADDPSSPTRPGEKAIPNLGRPDSASDGPSTLFDMLAGDDHRTTAAFIGDPSVAKLLGDQLDQVPAANRWYPGQAQAAGDSADASQDGDPSLCLVPSNAMVDPNNGTPVQDQASSSGQRPCPARDAQTLETASQALSAATVTPAFTYVHLAEVGRTKQLDGDADAPAPGNPASPPADPGVDGSTPTKRALADLDGALASFVASLQSPAAANLAGVWQKTVLVVTGSHGYEDTPPENRVPDPDNASGTPTSTSDTPDFGDFVVREGGGAGKTAFLPQGTVGTVYWPGAATTQLESLAAKITQRGNEACSCIDQVLSPGALPGYADLLAARHPGWYYDPLDGAARTGAGGDLLVTLKPGWAFGRTTATGPAPGVEGEDLDNPYPASEGGARNRPVAMLIDGPTSVVGQVQGNWLPVTDTPQNPDVPGGCAAGRGLTFDKANPLDKVGDDANAAGHECQPETVDVALSMAALLNVAVPSQQIAAQGRFLNEAFYGKLGFPKDDVPEEPPLPEEVPPPPEPPIIIERRSVQIIPTRKPRDPFPFRGLLQRLRARVVDSKGRPRARARRGAKLTSIEVTVDFGRPESLVRLTFYKRAHKGSGTLQSRLVAIARFKPFTIKRGPAKLRLRVPPQFAPTHIGVAVQEVRTVAAAAAGKKIEKPVGRPAGGITAIGDASWLHRRVPRRRG